MQADVQGYRSPCPHRRHLLCCDMIDGFLHPLGYFLLTACLSIEGRLGVEQYACPGASSEGSRYRMGRVYGLFYEESRLVSYTGAGGTIAI